VELTSALLAEDAVVFGLRLNAGVDLAALRARFPGVANWGELDAMLARLAEEAMLDRAGETVRLTRKGRLLADSVGGELMGVLE
jgi:oxygen-independent coproporphyrinogen-3 oxidase